VRDPDGDLVEIVARVGRQSPPTTPAATPRSRCHHGRVTVIKINAITVPEDSGDELARRFAARAGAVDDQDGFEGFELLKPTDDRTTWLVVTRWRDEAAFEAWVSSPSFAHGHRASGQDDSRSSGDDAGEAGHGRSAGPVGVHSELWSYEIAGGSPGAGS
jgi:heme-degrading monooxygenase HmoA